MSGRPPVLRLRRLPHGAGLPLPTAHSSGAAGLDLRAAVDAELVLPPGGRELVPTGFALAIPGGYEGQVRPRSGLALRTGLTLLNTPGTIDSDYRGELQILVVNLGSKAVTIGRGDRIAQLVIAPVVRPGVEEVEELDASERGDGGFGSTGVE